MRIWFISILLGGSCYAQNKIVVKKAHKTIDALFISANENSKRIRNYYCFKRDGYVYNFLSDEKSKKVIDHCQKKDWLYQNSSRGKYIYSNDSIVIFPIIINPFGKETTEEFHYSGTLDSTILEISAIGQPKENKLRFELLYPTPKTKNY